MSDSLQSSVTCVVEPPAVSAQERLEALLHSHQDRLYRLALRMTGDPEEARDLVQETFLRSVRHLHSLPTADHRAEAWLVRVLVNLCRDWRRRRRVRRTAMARNDLPTSAAPPDPEGSLVVRSAVAAALAELPARRRAVVVLREIEGKPVSDVARLLGVRPATVRWHLSLARRELSVRLAALVPGASERGTA